MGAVIDKPKTVTGLKREPIKITFVGEPTREDGITKLVVEKDCFSKLCPVPEIVVKDYINYVKEYNQAVAVEAVEFAKKEFKGDKANEHINVTSTFGSHKDKLITNVRKNKDYPAILDRKAFSQPVVSQTVKSSNIVNKANLKALVKDLQKSL